MDIFGLTADQVIARIHQNGASVSIPSLGRSILIGSLGFCFASLCVFATVAFTGGGFIGTWASAARMPCGPPYLRDYCHTILLLKLIFILCIVPILR